jgi:hypothetical protein
LVHGHKGGRHAGCRLEKAPAAEAGFAAQFIGHRQKSRFDFALPFILRRRIIFVAGHRLGGDRGAVRAKLRRHQSR